LSAKQDNQSVSCIYICGKHKVRYEKVYNYHLHIINDHDDKHGIWQEVGTTKWRNADNSIWYGRFRFLPMYFELECVRKNHRLTYRRERLG